MSDTPPIPPELCGINSCAFTPHPDDTAHTWAAGVSTRRIYSTDSLGCGIRREPDDADVGQLQREGRKVFVTKGSAA